MQYKRGKKKPWVVQLRDANGHIKTLSFTKRDDAAEFEGQFIRARERIRSGLERMFEPQTFGEFRQSWIIRRMQTNPKSTWSGEQAKLNNVWGPLFDSRQLQTITSDEISRELERLMKGGISSATRNRHRALLHTIFEDAAKTKLIGRGMNPVADIEALPEAGKKIELWKTSEESERYIVEALKLGTVYGVYATLQLWVGCRISETLALQWRDIDWDSRQVSIRRIAETVSREIFDRTKGDGEGGEHNAPLFPRVAAVLRDWQQVSEHTEPEDFILQLDGERITYWQILRIHRMTLEAAGLKRLTIHELRHVYATNAEKAGFAKGEIQRMLGHASITTTEIYTHIDTDHLVEKAKRLGFAAGLRIVTDT